jgi:hypothetical protein
LTREVPIFSYEPLALTMLSPGIEGTVKLTVPPALPVGGGLTGAEAVECAGVVAVTGVFVTAGCVAGAEVAGVEAGADAGAELAAVATAPTEPPEAGPDAAVDGVDPVPPHALRPVPPMMAAAMITTGTRRILMPLPFIELPDVTAGDNNGFVATIKAGRQRRRRLNQKKSTFAGDQPA